MTNETKYRVLAFTEGEFATSKTFLSLDKARAWADGFESGASCYGAGSASAFVDGPGADEEDAGAARQIDPAELARARAKSCTAREAENRARKERGEES